jgi:hypothetical protein
LRRYNIGTKSNAPPQRRKDTNITAKPLALASVILQEANDCGNIAANQDHWPLRTEFELGAVAPAPTRAELLQRTEALEQQVQELKALMQRLP